VTGKRTAKWEVVADDSAPEDQLFLHHLFSFSTEITNAQELVSDIRWSTMGQSVNGFVVLCCKSWERTRLPMKCGAIPTGRDRAACCIGWDIVIGKLVRRF
jgi:hypothetical protein